MSNLDIQRKEYGVWLGQNVTAEPHFAYDHVIDVLTIHNIYLAYNVYGLCVLLCFSSCCQQLCAHTDHLRLHALRMPRMRVCVEHPTSTISSKYANAPHDVT